MHFLKVTKFVFNYKWKRKFNLLKALSALRNTFSSWHSRSITKQLTLVWVYLICPIMHIIPIHISRICEISFIRKKHMTQKWDIFARFSTNPITYRWNLCWCKILKTDRWLISLFFSICLLLACGFSVAFPQHRQHIKIFLKIVHFRVPMYSH